MEDYMAAYVAAVVLSVLNVAAMAWMVVRRREPVVANRGYALAFVGCGFAALHAALLLIHYGVVDVLSKPLACHLVFWTSTLFIPVTLTSYILRCYHLFFQDWLSKSKARYLETRTEDYFLRHQWTDSSRTLWTVLAVYSLAWLVIMAAMIYSSASNPFNDVADDSACLVNGTSVAVMVQSAVALAVLFVFVVLLWRVDDAFYIKWELRLVGWTTLVLTIFWAIAQETTWLGSPSATLYVVVTMCEVFVAASCFMPAVLSHRRTHKVRIGVAGLWTLGQADRAHSDAVSASMADLAVPDSSTGLAPPVRSLTNLSLSTDLLRAVLVNPDLLESFKQFAMRSWCVENLLFVMEVANFRGHSDRPSLGRRAGKLVQIFIAESGPLQLNLMCATQCDLLKRLACGDIALDMFDDALLEVEKQLRHDTLAKWRQTESARIALARMNAA